MRQSQAYDIIELTSDQVLTMTSNSLIEHFSLVVNGYKFSADDIWNVVVAAFPQGHLWCCPIRVPAQNGSYVGRTMSFLKY
jgi:hypothetical protein